MGETAFGTIMQGIVANLTHEPAHDIDYLRKCCKDYRDHPLGREVIRACGRLMWDAAPPEGRDELLAVIESDRSGTRAVLDASEHFLAKGDATRALELTGPVVRRLSEMVARGWCSDDSESIFLDLETPVERALWHAHNQSPRVVRRTPEPLARAWRVHGQALVGTGDDNGAAKALAEAVRWNPACVGARLELAAALGRLGRLEECVRQLDRAYPYVASPADLARWQLAMARWHASGQQGPHPKTLRALVGLLSALAQEGGLADAIALANDLHGLTGDERFAEVARHVTKLVEAA